MTNLLEKHALPIFLDAHNQQLPESIKFESIKNHHVLSFEYDLNTYQVYLVVQKIQCSLSLRIPTIVKNFGPYLFMLGLT